MAERLERLERLERQEQLERQVQQEHQRAQRRARRARQAMRCHVREPIAEVSNIVVVDNALGLINEFESSSKILIDKKLVQIRTRIAQLNDGNGGNGGNVPDALDILESMSSEMTHLTKMTEAAFGLYNGWVEAVKSSAHMKTNIKTRKLLVLEALHSVRLLLPDLRMPPIEDGIEAMLYALAYAPGGKHFREAEHRFNGKRKAADDVSTEAFVPMPHVSLP
jgi:hypothetical protein